MATSLFAARVREVGPVHAGEVPLHDEENDIEYEADNADCYEHGSNNVVVNFASDCRCYKANLEK